MGRERWWHSAGRRAKRGTDRGRRRGGTGRDAAGDPEHRRVMRPRCNGESGDAKPGSGLRRGWVFVPSDLGIRVHYDVQHCYFGTSSHRIAPLRSPASESWPDIRISTSIACTSGEPCKSLPPTGLLLVLDPVWPSESDADSPANARVCVSAENPRSPVVRDQPGNAAPAECGGGYAVSCRSK